MFWRKKEPNKIESMDKILKIIAYADNKIKRGEDAGKVMAKAKKKYGDYPVSFCALTKNPYFLENKPIELKEYENEGGI